MEMRKHGQIQGTECMEFVGGEMRIISFLGHSNCKKEMRSLMQRETERIKAWWGWEIKSHPSATFNTYRD